MSITTAEGRRDAQSVSTEILIKSFINEVFCLALSDFGFAVWFIFFNFTCFSLIIRSGLKIIKQLRFKLDLPLSLGFKYKVYFFCPHKLHDSQHNKLVENACRQIYNSNAISQN